VEQNKKSSKIILKELFKADTTIDTIFQYNHKTFFISFHISFDSIGKK